MFKIVREKNEKYHCTMFHMNAKETFKKMHVCRKMHQRDRVSLQSVDKIH